MELFIILGILLGLVSICAAHLIAGSTLSSLLNIPTLIIVVGGSLAAIIVQTPKDILKKAINISRCLIYPPKIKSEDIIGKVLFWSKKKRQDSLLSIEISIYNLKDPFLMRGAKLLLAGVEKENLIEILGSEIDTIESRDINAAKVFEIMGGYTPTLGILGSVLGLIQVMGKIADPTELGAGIAVAFVATIYGVGFANLILLPLANRLKLYTYRRTRFYEMYLAGLVALIDNDSSQIIKTKIYSFISNKGKG